MTQKIILNKKDRKIKNRWRITLLVYLIITLISLYSELKFSTTKGELLVGFLLMAFFIIFLNGLLYYFSHVKQGYRLLIFTLITPIFLLSKINRYDFIGYFQISSPIEFLLTIFFGFIFYIWWCYVSINLIRLNKRNKKNNISEECKNEIVKLQTFKSMQDLDDKFHILITQFPQFESAISKEYQKRRNSFT